MDTNRINALILVTAIAVLACAPSRLSSQMTPGTQASRPSEDIKATYETILHFLGEGRTTPSKRPDARRALQDVSVTPDNTVAILDGLTAGDLRPCEDAALMSDLFSFLSIKLAEQPQAVNADLLKLVQAVRQAHIQDAEKVKLLDSLFGPGVGGPDNALAASDELLAIAMDKAAYPPLRRAASVEAWHVLNASGRKIALADAATVEYVNARASISPGKQDQPAGHDPDDDVIAAIKSGDLHLAQATADQLRKFAVQKQRLVQMLQQWSDTSQDPTLQGTADLLFGARLSFLDKISKGLVPLATRPAPESVASRRARAQTTQPFPWTAKASAPAVDVNVITDDATRLQIWTELLQAAKADDNNATKRVLSRLSPADLSLLMKGFLDKSLPLDYKLGSEQILLDIVGHYRATQGAYAQKHGTYDGASLRLIADLCATRTLRPDERVTLLGALTRYQEMRFDPGTLEYVSNVLLGVAGDEHQDPGCRVHALRSLLLLLCVLADDTVYHDPGYRARFSHQEKAPVVRAALQAGQVSLSDGASQKMRVLHPISQRAVSIVRGWTVDKAAHPMLKNFTANEWPNLESHFEETAFSLCLDLPPTPSAKESVP